MGRLLAMLVVMVGWGLFVFADPPAKVRSIFDFNKAEQAGPAEGARRGPAPDARALAEAEKGIHDTHAAQFADQTAGGRAALAKQLIGESEGKDAISRYAALNEARKLAILAENPALVSQAIERMSRTFVIDVAAAELASLKEWAAGNSNADAAGKRALAEFGGKAADDAILHDRYDTAVEAAEIANAAAKGANDAEAARRAAGHLADIRLVKDESAKVAPAMAKLQKSPADAEANLAAGKFLCLWRGDWHQGLPLLAKGSDVALKNLAQEELAAASDAPMQLAMGNAWWDVASKLEGPPRAYAQDHAADSYLQAIPNLDGIYKAMAQKRVAEAPARLPFPRPGEVETAAVRGAEPVAGSIYIAADDFVTQIYHNGQLVPNRDRKLLAEIFGAQIERVTLKLKPGDWVVFNVANNHLRWNGAYYFAAGFLNDKDGLVYGTELRSGNWSSCDDLKEIDQFVASRDHWRDHKPQPITNAWDRGDSSMKGAIPEWNGQGIWGKPDSQSTWIKFIAPGK